MVYSAQLECKSVLLPVEMLCNVNQTHLNYCNLEWQEGEGGREINKNMYLVNIK